MTSVLVRRGDTHNGEGHVKTEAVVGVMQQRPRNAVSHWRPKREEGFSPGRSVSLLYLDFGLRAPRTIRE